jgi:copper chaperone CopZ
MFTFFKKNPTGQQVKLQIQGMHCTSCAINIDSALEDTEGVFSASTSYARSTVTIEYDPEKITTEQLTQIIKAQGYKIE